MPYKSYAIKWPTMFTKWARAIQVGKDKSEKTTLGPELNESSAGSKIDDFMGDDSDSFDDPFANHEDFIGDNSTTSTTTLTTATTVTQTVTSTTNKTTDLTPSTSKSGSTVTDHGNDIGAIIAVISCLAALLLILAIALIYDWKTKKRCFQCKKRNDQTILISKKECIENASFDFS